MRGGSSWQRLPVNLAGGVKPARSQAMGARTEAVGVECTKEAPDGTKRDQKGPIGTKWDQIGPRGSKWDQDGPDGNRQEHQTGAHVCTPCLTAR